MIEKTRRQPQWNADTHQIKKGIELQEVARSEMRERNQRPSLMDRRSDFMKSVPQSSSLEETLSYVLEERATVVARETGCVQRQVKVTGATLLQTVVFGWLQHPDASLESLASTAEIRAVSVTDTAIHKRFTPQCAEFLHRMLEEISQVVVLADQDVPLALLRRFRTVVIEDRSSIALPDALAELWRQSSPYRRCRQTAC